MKQKTLKLLQDLKRTQSNDEKWKLLNSWLVELVKTF
jgi:hypothetical protein